MKTFFLFMTGLLLMCCQPKYDVIRKVEKQYQNPPPGTVWLKDSIFIDQTEVRNLDYLEYLHWLQINDTINYSLSLPDTLVWRDALSYNEPYVRYYLTHPAYRNYPVVGVSYEQAVNYCKWRTEIVKYFADRINPKSSFGSSYKAKTFYYRLPTKEEWEIAAYAGICQIYGFEGIHVNNNLLNYNVKEAALLSYASDVTVPAKRGTPNKFNLYNTIGNVAEMIAEKGVSKGGSWLHSLDECKITDSIKYEKPKAWLGFRCVCVVK
ncbi:MAG: hypothetical protein A3F72_06330 [Bacteroidetes bacterium RIFCSPLOWO2_12_FULL_35_15]|nr:MAG: hypothetical protein A3F72_06330 [Bacteroidetes bacterium RIFCSPLOWO2_12_FULL_35_15]